jgi:hypothetical protein
MGKTLGAALGGFQGMRLWAYAEAWCAMTEPSLFIRGQRPQDVVDVLKHVPIPLQKKFQRQLKSRLEEQEKKAAERDRDRIRNRL